MNRRWERAGSGHLRWREQHCIFSKLLSHARGVLVVPDVLSSGDAVIDGIGATVMGLRIEQA